MGNHVALQPRRPLCRMIPFIFTAQPPPPEKIDDLIEILNGPAVKVWLAERGRKSKAAESNPVERR